MQDDIESALAESRSLGLAGRFLHRYEKCQMALARQDDAGVENGAEIGRGGGEKSAQDGSTAKRSVNVAEDKNGPAQWSPQVASASHFMTLFLEAYVAARRVSANSHALGADKR